MNHLFTCLLLSLFAAPLSAQYFYDVYHSVKLSAEVSEGPASITVNWEKDEGAQSYVLYRRLYGSGAQWGAPLAAYDSTVTQYVDTDVSTGQLYEYKIFETNEVEIPGYGYVLSGICVPADHQAKSLLIVTTENTLAEVEGELVDYEDVLSRDGWVSRRLVIDTSAAISQIKADILAEYTAEAFEAALLFGDVPVPHSGEINPDAHNDHRGAWSADVYYADVDGEWTDETVNNVSSENWRNHNVPGDENWDQSFLPSDVEFAIGRVDFSEMPVFEAGEYEMLRQYLAKATSFRTGSRSVRQRAMIRNNNSWNGGLGQNGIRNYAPLVSPDSLEYDQWQIVFEEQYAWFYGGCAGNYSGSFMQGTSEIYANDDFQATFTAWFGSYFGDYDYPDAFMRAILGSGDVLSTVWAGAPHWHFHSMGMGFPLAEATRVTQNNDTIYTGGFFPRSIHVNLLGDPTLDATNYPGPADLVISEQQGFLQLNWQAAPDAVEQYYLYRRQAADQPFSLVDSVGPATTEWLDFCPILGERYEYLVRASRLETTPSGTFYNLSSGTSADILVSNDYSAIASFVANQVEDSLYLLNTSTFADSIVWLLPDGTTSEVAELSIQLLAGDNLVTLIAYNACSADTSQQVFPISSVDNPAVADFEYFPNPTNQYVIVSSDEAFQQLILSNTLGEVVAQDRFPASYLQRFTFGYLPAGNYTLTVLTDGRRLSRLLVIAP